MEKKKKEPVSYDEVFLYLSDKKYSCSDDSRKRAIRSKAAGFITADGVLITVCSHYRAATTARPLQRVH